MANILIDRERCKGCGLCVTACPKRILELDSAAFNNKGYSPALCIDQGLCIACAACGRMCPDLAIEVTK